MAATKYEIDEKGYPRLVLANVPDAGASTTDPDATSGNPQHDVRSGKFAPGSGEGGEPLENVPANTDAQAYLRQRDAVRDIAREMDELASGDIAELLAGRLTRPLEQEEMNQFLLQVRQQRIDDLVDMLDWQFRNLIETVKRGRRRVRLTAPRGWIRKTFNAMSDDEVLSVINRLEARGHSREDLSRTILSRIKKQDRRDALGAKLSQIPENDASLELAFVNDGIDWESFAEEESESPTIIINNIIDPAKFKE